MHYPDSNFSRSVMELKVFWIEQLKKDSLPGSRACKPEKFLQPWKPYPPATFPQCYTNTAQVQRNKIKQTLCGRLKWNNKHAHTILGAWKPLGYQGWWQLCWRTGQTGFCHQSQRHGLLWWQSQAVWNHQTVQPACVKNQRAAAAARYRKGTELVVIIHRSWQETKPESNDTTVSKRWGFECCH